MAATPQHRGAWANQSAKEILSNISLSNGIWAYVSSRRGGSSRGNTVGFCPNCVNTTFYITGARPNKNFAIPLQLHVAKESLYRRRHQVYLLFPPPTLTDDIPDLISSTSSTYHRLSAAPRNLKPLIAAHRWPSSSRWKRKAFTAQHHR